MEKVITVVAVMSIQPEQTPFKMDDMWTLLSRMTNAVAQMSQAPFYLPTMYNILLRITSPRLMGEYRNAYLDLVRLINDQVYPKLDGCLARTMLRVFLDRFLQSGGRDCEPFFSPDET